MGNNMAEGRVQKMERRHVWVELSKNDRGSAKERVAIMLC